jgi:transcriptional regulator with XRE-family HTH domain
MQTLPELGALLAARRKELGKTQSEVGRLAGLRQEELSRLESGQLAGFTARRLLRLAHVLGLTVSLQPTAAKSHTLDVLLDEVRSGANTGPGSR